MQLEALSATLQTVSRAAATTEILNSSSVLTSAVAKAGLAVQNVDRLITERLLGPAGTRSKTRRTTYLLNKRQLVLLQKELRVAREELLEAVAVESLSVSQSLEFFC